MIPRKAVHIHLSEDLHTAFRKLCIDQRLTMQEVCEYFISGILDEREDMLKVVNEISSLKKSKSIKKVSSIENDFLYDAISREIKR